MRSGEDRRKRTPASSENIGKRRSISDRRRENNNEYVTFFVGEQFIGVPIYDVQEVLTAQAICPVPSSSDNIAGIINLRGQIATVFNMHNLMKIKTVEKKDKSDGYMHVIIQDEGELYSFQVDSVGDVLTITKDSFAAPPANLDKQWAQCCLGIHHVNNQMMPVIDKGPLILLVKEDINNRRNSILMSES